MRKNIFSIAIIILSVGFLNCLVKSDLKEDNEDAIVLNTDISDNGFYTIPVIIGTPGQTFNLAFGIYEDTFVNGDTCATCQGNKFVPKNSTSFVANGTKVSLSIDPLIINGTYNYDKFNISNYASLENFFIVADYNGLANDGVIGFPVDKEDLKYVNTSIFDNIIKQNGKKRRILAFKAISDKNGKIFLGEYPKELTNGNFPFRKCNSELNNWSCKISYVHIGEYTKLSDAKKVGNESLNYDTAFISFNYNQISAPLYILPYFNTSYFNDTLNTTGCTIDSSTAFYQISCNSSIYNSTARQDVSFAFDNAAYRINGTNIFTQIGDNYVFNIRFVKDTNSWTFGSAFLKNFITVLDGDNQNIGFYGVDVKDFGSSNIMLIIIISLAVMIVLIVVIFMIFFCKKHEEGYISADD